MELDTTQLISRVSRAAKIPSGSSYLTAATLLGLASDELLDELMPRLLSVSGNHFLTSQDTAMSATASRYRLPKRCIRPERMELVTAEGMLVGHLVLADGRMLSEMEAGRYPPNQAIGWWAPDSSHVRVAMRSTTDATGRYLRMWYRRQPNRLTATSNCWRMASVDTINRSAIYAAINVGDVPGDPVVGVEYDLIKATPAFESFADDASPTTVNSGSSSVIFLNTDMTEAEDGDLIAPANYTPVPQLPPALFNVLVLGTASRVLSEQGNQTGAAEKRAEALRKLEVALSAATPRSDEAETAAQNIWDWENYRHWY